MKHTIAPWHVKDGKDGAGHFIVCKGGAEVCEVFDAGQPDCGDAHLIAAAPDLLAALEGFVGGTGSLRDACIAIAKARGVETAPLTESAVEGSDKG